MTQREQEAASKLVLSATKLAPQLQQYAQLIDEATPEAIEQAVAVARTCIQLSRNRAVGYELLGRALCLQGKFSDAVACYKTGLEVDPSNEALQTSLRSARLAVVDDLLRSDDDDLDYGDEAAGGGGSVTRSIELHQAHSEHNNESFALSTAFDTTRHRQQPQPRTTTLSGDPLSDRALVFDAKVERILEHLDLGKLSRLATLYVLTELLRLRSVTLGLALLLLGVLGQALVHRHKFMAASILVLCLYQSRVRLIAWRQLDAWARTSSDKLGAFTWAPRVAAAVPIAMKVFGQLKFVLFLQRDAALSLVVCGVTSALVVCSLQDGVSAQLKRWGHGKHLKFVAYAVTILYWGIWRGEAVDTLRLLPPALIDAGGIVLSSVTPDELQRAVRAAWRKLYTQVADSIQQDVDFDAWFVLGLGNWVVDYWQQPSDFSLEALTRMLAECFSAFETTAVGVFRPELRRLKTQMAHLGESSEMAVLVAYLKTSLREIPPPRALGLFGLFAKRCSSFVVLALLITFYGSLSLPLAPFLWSERQDAHALYSLYTNGDLDALDGLEILLLESPLLRVWENVRAAVYCLEGSLTLSKAMETGTQIMTAAMHLSRLATFAARLKTDGVAANAHELPEHLSSAYRIAKDSSAIVEGLKHVYASAHFQDLQTYVADWWRRKLPAAAATDQSEHETTQ